MLFPTWCACLDFNKTSRSLPYSLTPSLDPSQPRQPLLECHSFLSSPAWWGSPDLRDLRATRLSGACRSQAVCEPLQLASSLGLKRTLCHTKCHTGRETECQVKLQNIRQIEYERMSIRMSDRMRKMSVRLSDRMSTDQAPERMPSWNLFLIAECMATPCELRSQRL